MNKYEKPDFLLKYGKFLNSFAQKLKEKNADYILAMPRKAPRLLELCSLWGINFGNSDIVITSKALDFMDSAILQDKKIIITDDIIIVGSTIARMRAKNSFLEKTPIFCLIRHDKWYTEELFTQCNSDSRIFGITKLGQREAAEFCTDLVQSIAYLNKPYDIDHPIFYTQLTYKELEKFCNQDFFDEAYEISTPFHRSIKKRRFSFIPKKPTTYGFLNSLFQNKESTSEQIIKCRLYYDESTERISFVPVFIFRIDSSIIDANKPKFGKPFEEYNELINNLLEKYVKAKTSIYCYHRLVSYIGSYLYGLAFCIRNSENRGNLFTTQLPSHFINSHDLFYLFGQHLSNQLLYGFDSLYPKTVETIHRLYASKTKHLAKQQDLINLSYFDSNPFENDSEAKNLLERIKPYLDNSIHRRESLVDKLACIFESLFLKIEISARHRIKSKGTLEDEEPRLEMGFNHEQIFKTLTDYGAISPYETDSLLRLSLAIDILVDRGVMVPFYKEKNGKFERLYRYGENGLGQLRTKFLFARVFEEFFHQIIKIYNRKNIPKIPMEKILVLLRQKLKNSPDDIKHLKLDGKAGYNTLNLGIAFWIHGAVTEVEVEIKGGKPRTYRFTDWLVSEGILRENEVESRKYVGYSYSDEFYKSILAQGEEKAEDNSMVPDKISSEYYMLAEILWHIKSVFDELHKEKKTKFDGDKVLICLSTCSNIESTLDAMREEFVYLFQEDDPKKITFGKGYCLQKLFGVLLSDLIGANPTKGNTNVAGLWKKCDRQLKNADEAANSTILKYALFKERKAIIEEIRAYFKTPQIDSYLKTYYYNQLTPIINSISRNTLSTLTSIEIDALNRILELGNLFVKLCAILKISSSITYSLFVGPRTNEGILYLATVRKIKNEISILNKDIGEFNNMLNCSHTSFSGIEVNNLPRIKQISNSNTNIPEVTQWASAYKELIENITHFWNSMRTIYYQNYSTPSWKDFKHIAFPKDTRATRFNWSLWFDIKDSQGEKTACPENKEKSLIVIRRINKALKDSMINIKDARFTPEPPSEDDEKFISTVRPESLIKYLSLVLQIMDSSNMFIRAGIGGVGDTGENYFEISDSSCLSSKSNFAFLKRLGECIKPKNIQELMEHNGTQNIKEETCDSHTIVISNEAWRNIWGKKSQLGKPISVKYLVQNVEKEIHIFSKVSKGANVYPK